MKHALVGLGLATALFAFSSHSLTALDTDAIDMQADAAVGKQLLGTWRLVSWTQRFADGSARPAASDVGYLIYTDVNRMCAMLMDSRRPKWTPGTPASVADAQARNAGYTSYCAAVEINAKEGFVLHRVDMDRNPNIIGTTRKRWFRFQGPNVLTLSIDATELPGEVKESVLTWQRVLK